MFNSLKMGWKSWHNRLRHYIRIQTRLKKRKLVMMTITIKTFMLEINKVHVYIKQNLFIYLPKQKIYCCWMWDSHDWYEQIESLKAKEIVFVRVYCMIMWHQSSNRKFFILFICVLFTFFRKYSKTWLWKLKKKYKNQNTAKRLLFFLTQHFSHHKFYFAPCKCLQTNMRKL